MEAPSATRPTQILVIRHAEKPALLGGPRGVDVNGDPHPHSLVVRGWQRAGALVPFFCGPRADAFAPLTHVYSPPAHGADGDHGRPFETIVAVAERLGVTPDTRFTLDEEAALVGAVLAGGGVALIAWEHKRIPRIANAILGDATPAPQSWPDDRFDVVWIFNLDAGSRTYRSSVRAPSVSSVVTCGGVSLSKPYGCVCV
ncbi:MAG: hypothetical protein NVSMB64_26730 [Candidatus Velthaea sp.]